MSIFSRRLFAISLSGMLLSGIALLFFLVYLNSRLPSADQILEIQLQIPLRIFSAEGTLIAEFGEKRRLPLEIDAIPTALQHAIIATEDRRFYEHHGVDLRGLLRAASLLIQSGRKEQGGSTITMQVARNFFLSREKTYSRKINEILLALKIDRELPKEKILELYLNKIYFGKNAYGVGAAAEVYYGKSIDQLSLAQMAMLAGLPQAPSAINPLNNPSAAKARRNHVLTRMARYGFISPTEAGKAMQAPLSAAYHRRQIELDVPYIAETVRQTLLKQFGRSIYNDGFVVTTTIKDELQKHAERSIQNALFEYDLRHGYRGPLMSLPFDGDLSVLESWRSSLESLPTPPGLSLGVIVDLEPSLAYVMLTNGELVTLTLEQSLWAKKIHKGGWLGKSPEAFSNFLSVADVIYVRKEASGDWRLSQNPEIEGALIALNPNSGEVEAMVGGYDFQRSHFNHVTLAQRQVGSAFKPFIYAAALHQGLTAATLINDAPIVFDDPTLQGRWRPQNSSRRFYGPTRLREGIVKSRNLVSIRLLQSVGLSPTLDFLKQLGFEGKRLPRGLSLALGSNTLSPLELASGYAILANGGKRIPPTFIHAITDEFGTPYPLPERVEAAQVLSPDIAYLMTSMLQEAIQLGTGRRAKTLNRTDIAGKTGTTNDQHDNWFAGYHPDLVCVTWMGFDRPKSTQEYGAQSALPAWIDFMQYALKTLPKKHASPPAGMVRVRIDPESGEQSLPSDTNGIFELFREGHLPARKQAQIAPSTTQHDTAVLF